MHKLIRLFSLVFILIAIMTTATACGEQSTDEHDGMEMAALNSMPASVKAAPVTVQHAYQFAVANPAALQNVPCYCGCGSMGHTSNYDCFVQETDAAGIITYDEHALGCSICVDIAQDVMRLHTEGQSAEDIYTYIDTTYSQYGPSNFPAGGSQ